MILANFFARVVLGFKELKRWLNQREREGLEMKNLSRSLVLVAEEGLENVVFFILIFSVLFFLNPWLIRSMSLWDELRRGYEKKRK